MDSGKSDNIKFRVVKPEESEKIVDFVIEHFYRDEPLCSLEPKIVPTELDRMHILKCTKGGTSIMAVQETPEGEKLVAINIGVVKGPESVQEYYDEAAAEGNTKYGQILKLLGDANTKADIFKRYNVDKVFYSFMSCVEPTLRGCNMGTRLKTELMALAKRLGYKVVTVDCTGFYSARVVERMGWELMNTVYYKDYKDESGKQIFEPPAPHEGLKTYAVRV